jgi:hypothetical protein
VYKFSLNIKKLIVMARPKPMSRKPGLSKGRPYGKGGKAKKS